MAEQYPMEPTEAMKPIFNQKWDERERDDFVQRMVNAIHLAFEMDIMICYDGEEFFLTNWDNAYHVLWGHARLAGRAGWDSNSVMAVRDNNIVVQDTGNIVIRFNYQVPQDLLERVCFAANHMLCGIE